MPKTEYSKALRIRLNKLERIVVRGHCNMPVGASILNEPRLIFCVEGTAHYQCVGVNRSAVLEFRKGSAVYIAAGRWVLAVPQCRYVCVGVIFHQEFIRLYRVSFTPDKSRPVRALVKNELVISHPPGEEVDALCRLLESEAFPDVSAECGVRLAECLCRIARALLHRPSQARAGKAYLTWQAARFYLDEHLHEGLDRWRIADYLKVHPNHLSRLCLAFEHQPFAHFVQSQRLQRSQLLLADPSLNVAEVAERCGFGSASYFIRLYHRRFGLTPVASRRQGSHSESAALPD